MHFTVCPCTVARLCCSVAFFMYHRCSNYASFLILCQNATFQTSNFQWCVTLKKLISYCCVTITQISWLRKWMVIIACHRWYIKLRHIHDMAETSLEKKQQRYKRTRKRTRPIRFKHGNAVEIRNGIMFNFYPGLLHFIQISTTLLASFSMISEAEHSSGACWSSLQNFFSPVFAHLALLQDSFYRCFLIMCHISNVASQFMLSEFLFLRYIAQIIIFWVTHN